MAHLKLVENPRKDLKSELMSSQVLELRGSQENWEEKLSPLGRLLGNLGTSQTRRAGAVLGKKGGHVESRSGGKSGLYTGKRNFKGTKGIPLREEDRHEKRRSLNALGILVNVWGRRRGGPTRGKNKIRVDCRKKIRSHRGGGGEGGNGNQIKKFNRGQKNTWWVRGGTGDGIIRETQGVKNIYSEKRKKVSKSERSRRVVRASDWLGFRGQGGGAEKGRRGR